MLIDHLLEDYHFDAIVGDLKLDSILKIYAQISGAQPSKDVKDHAFVFEELHLNISRKLQKKEKEEIKEKEEKGEKTKKIEEPKENAKAIEGKSKKADTEGEAEKAAIVVKTEESEKNKTMKKSEKKDDKEKAAWSFELSGKVSFNDVKSVSGLVKIDNTGLTIQGGLEDYKIKDTDVTIKEAAIDIFIGAKPDPAKKKSEGSKAELAAGTADANSSGNRKLKSKNTATKELNKDKVAVFNRSSKFSIKGIVKFSGLTVTVMFLTERKETNSRSKKAPEREWVLFGVYDADLCLSKICKDLAGKPIGDIQLRNIALIAASGEIKTVKELNTLKYPVKKGMLTFFTCQFAN